jgi:hypothetical protein
MSAVTALAPAPVRPSYVRVLGGALAGSLVAWLGLAAVVAGADLLGLLERRGTQGIVAGVLSHPFASNGPWSLLADIGVALLLLAVMSAGVAAGVAYATGRRVSWSRVLLFVALTGWAPFLGNRPLGGSLAVVVVAWLVQRWGIDRVPAFLLRQHALAVAAALGAAVLVAVSYAETHPLWTSTAFRAGDAVVVSVHNVGFARVTVVGLMPSTPPHHLPAPPLAISARSFGTLVLPYGCGTAYVATVTYRLLGRTLSAPLAVRIPNGTPCS